MANAQICNELWAFDVSAKTWENITVRSDPCIHTNNTAMCGMHIVICMFGFVKQRVNFDTKMVYCRPSQKRWTLGDPVHEQISQV